MSRYTLGILVATAAILFGSGMVAVLARRAFRRSQLAALRMVSIGFACFGVGAATRYLSVGTGSIYTGMLVQTPPQRSAC